MSRRRVVIVHSSDELYGADRILLHIVEAFRALDVDLEVWLPNDVEHGPFPLCRRLDEHGVIWRHVDLPIMRRAALRPVGVARLAFRSLRTAREIRRGRYDLVYLSSSASLLVAPVARLLRVPHRVLHIQERWEGRSASVLRWLARSTTARIAISSYVAETTGLGSRGPTVIENVVEDARARVRADRLGSTEEVRFVVASRWNRWKGHQTLLDAWERADFPGTLTVLGGPPSSGEAVDVVGLVAALPRPDSVLIVGEVPDVATYVADADVLILPSDDPEPFGLVVIEAFSLGRPVIASRAGGPLEIIEDGVSGWFFEPRDVDALADLLRGLDIAEIRRAGGRAREVYEARFEPTRFRAQLATLIASELDHP